MIDIVKRIIELKLEFWKKGSQEDAPMGVFLRGKSDGLEQALVVIDGFLNYDEEIHKLIDESRK
ncbi:hypothetical protein LCGC14_2768040 [marine sediment metagenome]|uniref:Uncharacterized protein n=1 Tax=marine sediment metagenome TaxID=412755 RepID=A0A0F8YWY6_9ZZZZ